MSSSTTANLGPPAVCKVPLFFSPDEKIGKKTSSDKKILRELVRLAAIAWPRGDAQSKARQVLMKRLGVTQEESETIEMTLQRYLNLFKGPMSDLIIKALVALSGLDRPAMSRQIVMGGCLGV